MSFSVLPGLSGLTGANHVEVFADCLALIEHLGLKAVASADLYKAGTKGKVKRKA